MKPIEDINLSKAKNADDLIKQMRGGGGFVAKKVAAGVDILETMTKDKECFTFLSFPAAIMATGARGIIVDLVKNKLVDAVITTCGTMDHDLARLWKDYYHGTFNADDAALHREGINRLGNIFVPNDSYGIVLEKKMQPMLQGFWDVGVRKISTHELVWAFGEEIDGEPKAAESLTYWAWKNKIPVFIPGPTDGAWGSQMWMFWQDHKEFALDLFADEQALSDIVYKAKKSGALMIGGGISKHHTIWWNQFRDGLDYAVQITTAPEWDGSLSGAQVREAVSWGKVREDAKENEDYVTIEADATSILPLMAAALFKRLNL